MSQSTSEVVTASTIQIFHPKEKVLGTSNVNGEGWAISS